MRLLSYPFHLEANGIVATVEEGSDAANAEQLAVLILTRPGERDLAPTFGVPDPAFQTLELNDVAAGVELFGPPVDVVGVDVSYPNATTEEVVVEFA